MALNIERNLGIVESQFTEFLAHRGGLVVVKGMNDDR